MKKNTMMEDKIFVILEKFENGNLTINEAQNQIMDLFGVSKNSILCGGDSLPERRLHCLEDCKLIKEVLIEKGFVNAGLCDAMYLWEDFSESYAAGWMGLPKGKEEIFECVKPHIKTIHYCGNL